jgi:hypothetical protein
MTLPKGCITHNGNWGYTLEQEQSSHRNQIALPSSDESHINFFFFFFQYWDLNSASYLLGRCPTYQLSCNSLCRPEVRKWSICYWPDQAHLLSWLCTHCPPTFVSLFYKMSKFMSVPWRWSSSSALLNVATLIKSPLSSLHCLWHIG